MILVILIILLLTLPLQLIWFTQWLGERVQKFLSALSKQRCK